MTGWFSQGGQDEWVMGMLGHLTSGYFVDVGAYDGVQHSNTLALELAGWDGVCVEANAEMALACALNRRCRTEHVAITESRGFVGFSGDRIVEVGGTQVPCDTLTAVLDQASAPPVIDYLSLDIEGGELDALRSLDWDRYQFKVATIEHNLYAEGPARKQAIYEFLTALGYHRLVEDAVVTDPSIPQYLGVAYEDWYSA